MEESLYFTVTGYDKASRVWYGYWEDLEGNQVSDTIKEITQ